MENMSNPNIQNYENPPKCQKSVYARIRAAKAARIRELMCPCISFACICSFVCICSFGTCYSSILAARLFDCVFRVFEHKNMIEKFERRDMFEVMARGKGLGAVENPEHVLPLECSEYVRTF